MPLKRYFLVSRGFVISSLLKCISVKSIALSERESTVHSASSPSTIFGVNPQIKRKLIVSEG